MRWHDKEFDNHKVFDSKELSEDTQRIRTDLVRSTLEEESQKEEYREQYLAYKTLLKRQKKKRIRIIIGVFVILIILGISITAVILKKYSHIGDLEIEAEHMIEQKNYKKAGEIYKRLYEETDNPQYIQKYNFTTFIIDNNNVFEDARSNIKNGDYESAICMLLTIHTCNSSELEKINNIIDEASTKWLESIRRIYISGDKTEATNEINKLVNILPDNIAAVEFRNIILDKDDTLSINEYRNHRNYTGIHNNNEIKRMYTIARPLIGSNQVTANTEASVYEKADKSSRSMGRLKPHTRVYIQDIFVYDVKNIWCKILYPDSKNYKSGWILYNNIFLRDKGGRN